MSFLRCGARPVSFLLGLVSVGMFCVGSSTPARAAENGSLPIPRFASMKHGEVNLRVGPDKRYPILWVLTRKDMPVEIIAEFDIWRKIRDWEGDEGWVMQQALQGRRSMVVRGEIATMRDDPSTEANPVAHLEPGVIGKLDECQQPPGTWCKVEVKDAKGWLRRTDFWGVYKDEAYP